MSSLLAGHAPGSLRRSSKFGIGDSNVVYEYPYLATNSAGDVGITFSWGGPTVPPAPVTGILTGRAIELFEIVAAGSLNAGADRSQGDYSTIQPDGDNPVRFIAGGYVANFDSNGNAHNYSWYARFGRVPSPRPPTVHITAPINGATPGSDVAVTYRGTATDSTGAPITGDALTWSEDGTVFGHGSTVSHQSTQGDHSITLIAVDSSGRSSSTSITVHITAPSGAPTIAIDSPIPGQNYPQGNQTPIHFQAHTSNPGGHTLSVQWTDDYTDAGGHAQHQVIGSTLSFDHTLYWNTSSPTTHTITATVNDGAGHIVSDHVVIRVGVVS